MSTDCDVSKDSQFSVPIRNAIVNVERFLNPYHMDILPKTEVPISGITIFVRNLLTGGVSASIAVTIMAPVERIKLILQIQHALGPKPGRILYTGLFDALRRIPKEQGFLSFWRGNFASVMRGFPYQALNFALRDKYKDYFVRGYSKTDQFWSRVGGNLLVGGLSGASSMAVLYPLDYARTRMAMDFGQSKKTREIKSIQSVFKETYRLDGLRGLYRGFWFSLVGVFIYRSAYFGLFDTAKDAAPKLGIEHLRHTFLFAFFTAECSASISGVLAYPFDTVRRFMMMESARPKPERKYDGSWHCMKTIYGEKGIRGFYNGGWVNVIRGTGGALMLVLYDEIQHEMWRKDTELTKAQEEECNRKRELSELLRKEPVCASDPSAVECQKDNSPKSQDFYDDPENDPCQVRKFIERINLICDH